MPSKPRILACIGIAATLAVTALNLVKAQTASPRLLLVQDTRIILVDPVSRQETIQEMTWETAPTEFVLWNATTLIGVRSTDPQSPRSLMVIDLPTGNIRCTLELLTPYIDLNYERRHNPEVLALLALANAQAGLYAFYPASCELTLHVAVGPGTSVPHLPTFMQLSPDRTYAVYTIPEGGDPVSGVWNAHLLHLATGESRQINDPSSSFDSPVSFVWSPDGRYLAYGASGGYTHDFLLDTVNETTVQLSTSMVEIISVADWSDDGRYLLYSNDTGDALLFDAETRNIQAIDAVGPLHFFRNSTYIAANPLCISCPGQPLTGIWTFDDGQLGPPLFEGQATMRVWSHNGAQVAYYDEEQRTHSIFHLDDRQTTTFAVESTGLLRYIWSPNDTMLAFTGAWEGEFSDVIGYYRLDTNEVRTLTMEGLREIAWSPDGHFLIYQDVAQGDEVVEVRLHDVVTHQSRLLYTYPRQEYYTSPETFLWSPDSRHILVAHQADSGLNCPLNMVEVETDALWSPACEGETRAFYWLP